MMRSCVTISLVEQARGGPFVLWDGLQDGCRKAQQAGFDAIEIFPPSGQAVDVNHLRKLLSEHSLELGAVGTGAGWVTKKWTLTNPDDRQRKQAIEFVQGIIDLAGSLGAPAIIGSMQNAFGLDIDRTTALLRLGDSIHQLAEHARQYDTVLLLEPINRYESNLINTIGSGIELLESLSADNVRLLADLFHMNIEEVDIAGALRLGGKRIGHVHLVDSNRRAAGLGHLDFEPIARALHEIQFDGFTSAEALPLPTSDEALRQTIASFRRYFLLNA